MLNLHLDPTIFIAVGIFLLVGFPVHEFSHALAAYRLGDGTAKMMGRLTLNPIKHLDPLGSGLLVLSAIGGGFFFGWAKPTPVNPTMLRGGRRSESLVALAGPASNLVMAIAAAIPMRVLLAMDVTTTTPGALGFAFKILAYFLLINIFLGLFNLVPIPPLDGYKILLGFLPPRTAWQIRPMLDRYGFIILILVFFLPVLNGASIGSAVIGTIADFVINVLVG